MILNRNKLKFRIRVSNDNYYDMSKLIVDDQSLKYCYTHVYEHIDHDNLMGLMCMRNNLNGLTCIILYLISHNQINIDTYNLTYYLCKCNMLDMFTLIIEYTHHIGYDHVILLCNNNIRIMANHENNDMINLSHVHMNNFGKYMNIHFNNEYIFSNACNNANICNIIWIIRYATMTNHPIKIGCIHAITYIRLCINGCFKIIKLIFNYAHDNNVSHYIDHRHMYDVALRHNRSNIVDFLNNYAINNEQLI